jgi:hypothetical protein
MVSIKASCWVLHRFIVFLECLWQLWTTSVMMLNKWDAAASTVVASKQMCFILDIFALGYVHLPIFRMMELAPYSKSYI